MQAFTPDGKAVLFTSQRATYTSRYLQLFTVPVGGGMEEQLPIPNAASRRRIRPTARRIAYNPIPPRFQQWKAYRGGTASEIWLYNRKDHAVEEIPQPKERANDVRPDVDRRHRLLPLRPQRRVQPLRVRHQDRSRCGR